MEASEPLRVVEATERFDVDATITGGGISGQAGAAHGPRPLARRARAGDPLHPQEGRLAHPRARKKESKKYGLKKARKAPQFTKR